MQNVEMLLSCQPLAALRLFGDIPHFGLVQDLLRMRFSFRTKFLRKTHKKVPYYKIQPPRDIFYLWDQPLQHVLEEYLGTSSLDPSLARRM